ncbi:MAG: type IV secretion system DNA-binding domain-containing protein [Desulfomonilia bacterium]
MKSYPVQSQSYEGFETWWNQLRMSIQMHTKIVAMLFCFHVLIFFLACWYKIDNASIRSASQWLFAYTMWPTAKMKFTNPNGTIAYATAQRIAACVPLRAYSIGVFYTMRNIFFWCAAVYIFYVPIWMFFHDKAKNLSDRKHIRGSRLSTIKEFNYEVKKRKEEPGLPVGSVRMPKSLEPRHTFIIGGPGAGKTNCAAQIIEDLKKRNAQAIIYDFKGDYLRRFYEEEKDIIFNPLDARSVGWNLFNEIETPMDIDAMATSLIPHSISQIDTFFPDAARDVFAGILYYLYNENQRSNRHIWETVTSDAEYILECLQGMPEGRGAAKHIELPGSTQSQGVFGTLMEYAKGLKYMAQTDGQFKIKDWLHNGEGMIYITNYSIIQEALRPILSLFVDLLGRQVLSLSESTERRIFFLLDEFGTLQRLPTIVKLLTMARSKGGCVFIGIQDYGQIDQTYSTNHRQSIINACGNKIIFNVDDPTSAKISSDILSETEYVEMNKTRSMGVNDNRDGTTLAERTKRESLIMPAELMKLPDLTAIIRFKTYDPLITTFEHKDYPDKAPGFVMREDLLLKPKPKVHEPSPSRSGESMSPSVP